MDTALYIQTIKKECAFLEKEGYQFNQVDRNIYYTKNTETEGFRISFSWLEYGDKFDTYGITAEKRFNVVEEEIHKILGGELENYYTIHSTPSFEYLPDGLKFSGSENKNCFATNTINDIELFGEFIKSYYQSDVITFFNNHKEFIETAKFYEKLEREKVSTLILNTGTDIFYRELVIKNKSRAKDENDFAQMVITELEPMKSNSTFGKILENFKILKSNLHTTV